MPTTSIRLRRFAYDDLPTRRFAYFRFVYVDLPTNLI